MKEPDKPEDEQERLAALRSYKILDTPPEPEFDDIVGVAAALMDVPIALVSLVDSDRQWFKARFGLDATQTGRDISFCGHAILGDGVFTVGDTADDERFSDNPLVTDDPRIRFYAGAPLTNEHGSTLGTLCVIDRVPRSMSSEQQGLLASLARLVVRQLELRRYASDSASLANVAARRATRLENQISQKFSENDVMRFFRASLDLLCIASFDGDFVQLNPVWRDVLGWEIDELIGTPFLGLIHPADQEKTVALAARLSLGAGDTTNFENRYRCKDGSYRWFRWTATADLETREYFAIARDITAARSNAEQLRDAAARMHAVLETALDGIITMNHEGVVESFNTAASDIFGYHAAEVVGQNVSMLMPQPYRREHDGYLHRYHETQEPRIIGSGREVEGQRKDGTTFPLDLAVSRVDLADGTLMFTGIVRDISERKMVEQLKNEFISTVSHELRTPLTSISGSLRLVEAGITGELPEEAAQLVRIASINSQRLISLINDILDLEKIESGSTQPALSPVDIRTVVTRSVTSLLTLASEAGVAILSDQVESERVIGDEDRLVQVVVNLLSNAIKFSPTDSRVTLRAAIADGLLRLEVTDQGAGIPEDQRERIFEKFQQADGSATRTAGGTGLGLAISKAIIGQHGGEIGIESEPGAGATFWFTVPVDEGTPLVATSSSAPRSILIVENDESLGDMLRSTFVDEGYNVAVARTLSEAQKCVETAPPDAIVLDLRLPDGSGLELWEQVRKTEQLDDIPVVVVTVDDGELSAARAHTSLVDWLVRPVSHERVLEAVRRAVRPAGRARVLVVEDDHMLRDVICRSLVEMGVECYEAGDGRQALDLIALHAPDLIILDVGLPVLTGFDVVELLKDGKFGTTPLLVLTGRDLSESDLSHLRLGVTRHLMKSATSQDAFLDMVRDLLPDLIDESS